MDTDQERQNLRSFRPQLESVSIVQTAIAADTRPNNYFKMLEIALLHRSLSVPSDEPLCIRTLMGLDIRRVIPLKEQYATMREIWLMLAKRFNGIPASIVFCGGLCLSYVG